MSGIDPDAVAWLTREMAEILPSVRTERVRSMGKRHRTTVLQLIAWSPSLHAVRCNWLDTNATGTPMERVEVLLSMSGQLIAVQSERAQRGMDIGRTHPIDVGEPGAFDHMLVETSVMALLADRQGGGIATIEAAAHHYNSHYARADDGGIIIGNEGMIRNSTFEYSIELGPSAGYDGAALTTTQRLPETMMIAVTGKRLGDIATVPSIIADRIVTGAEHDPVGGGTRIMVEPTYVTIGSMREDAR